MVTAIHWASSPTWTRSSNMPNGHSIDVTTTSYGSFVLSRSETGFGTQLLAQTAGETALASADDGMNADTDMMTIVGLAIAVGSVMLMAIFWLVLPQLLRK